jgi:hypothetical protein
MMSFKNKNNKTIHNFRINLFKKEQEFTLTENSIIVRSKTNSESIILNTIKKVNLQHIPGFRGTPEQYLCIIQGNQNKKIRFGSSSIIKAATFEDRRNSYLKFVNELHSKLENKNIIYEKGSGIYFPFFVFYIIASIFFLFMSIYGFTSNKLNVGIVMLLALIGFGFVGKRMLKSLKKGTYNPKEIPDDLLP